MEHKEGQRNSFERHPLGGQIALLIANIEHSGAIETGYKYKVQERPGDQGRAVIVVLDQEGNQVLEQIVFSTDESN